MAADSKHPRGFWTDLIAKLVPIVTIAIIGPQAVMLSGKSWAPTTAVQTGLDRWFRTAASPYISNSSLSGTIRSQYQKSCPEQLYRPYIFSTDPLIVYLDEFLSYEETRYILDLAKPHYVQSPIGKGNVSKAYDKNIRSSQTAVLPKDPVVDCIERRSMEFQGFRPRTHLEDIQVQRYEVNDQFRPHYDWSSSMENPRISTIFAYLECNNCVGGTTQFPRIVGKFSAQWCSFIECGLDPDGVDSGGVGFKPITGNAIFWSHLYPNGTGHPQTWHAGMPVKKGSKYGMNIMTRKENVYS